MGPLNDHSISVTRAFRADGTTYPVFWEVRNSGQGIQVMAGVRTAEGEFIDPVSNEVWNRKATMHLLADLHGMTSSDAARITWWLVENGLIQQ